MRCLSYLSLCIAIIVMWAGDVSGQDTWSKPTTIGAYQSSLPKEWDRAFAGQESSEWNSVPRQFPPAQSARFRQDAPDYPPPGPQNGALTTPDSRNADGFVASQQAGNGNGCSTPSRGCEPCYGRSSHRDANWIVGVHGLAFARDYEDDLGLSSNLRGESLFSTDADLDYFGGVETFLGRRGCNGRGWEARYWGLYPNTATSVLGTLPVSELTGLADLNYAPSGSDVLTIFNSADAHSVTRLNTFHNVELNLLRNGGSYRGLLGNPVSYELLGGFRWLYFTEEFRYIAFGSVRGLPSQLNYCAETRNSLMGLQLGGRSERQLTCRLSLANSVRGGLFYNRIRQGQCVGAVDGVFAEIGAGPDAGLNYDFRSYKTDMSFLGELDLGLLYQVSSRARLSFGYRAIGIAGVALAPDQLPRNFTDVPDIRRIDSNGSLILHGAYGGLHFCF